MIRTKKLSLSLFLFCLLTPFMVLSQSQRERGQEFDEMVEQLNLTEEQKLEMEALRAERKLQMEEIRQIENLEEKKVALKAFRKSSKNDLEQILNTEQLDELRTMRDERKAEREEKRSDRKEFRHKHKDQFKAMHKEMKTYKQQNIVPVMKEKRLAFEEVLSQSDKELIDQLRTELQSQKKERKAERKERMESFEISESKEHRNMRKRKTKGSRMASMLSEEQKSQIKILTEKYSEELEQIKIELEPDQQKWEEDLRNIKDRNLEGIEFPIEHEERVQKMRKENKDKRKAYSAARFILMDPFKEDRKFETNDAEAPAGNYNLHKARIYPNPALSSQTLEFFTEKSGPVSIDVIDKSGQVLKRVFDQNLEAGAHKVEIDLRGLQGYVFYYRISDPQGTSSTKFMIKQ